MWPGRTSIVAMAVRSGFFFRASGEDMSSTTVIDTIPIERRWLTVQAASDHASLSTDSIRRLISSGKLAAHRPTRGRILIDRRQLDTLIEASTARLRSGRGVRRQVSVNANGGAAKMEEAAE
jgi:excisionase family DNA binding protein